MRCEGLQVAYEGVKMKEIILLIITIIFGFLTYQAVRLNDRSKNEDNTKNKDTNDK